jgi:hypothetical protein
MLEYFTLFGTAGLEFHAAQLTKSGVGVEKVTEISN